MWASRASIFEERLEILCFLPQNSGDFRIRQKIPTLSLKVFSENRANFKYKKTPASFGKQWSITCHIMTFQIAYLTLTFRKKPFNLLSIAIYMFYCITNSSEMSCLNKQPHKIYVSFIICHLLFWSCKLHVFLLLFILLYKNNHRSCTFFFLKKLTFNNSYFHLPTIYQFLTNLWTLLLQLFIHHIVIDHAFSFSATN